MSKGVNKMRILRAVFIVLVAFACTAAYNQGQWVWHNHPEGWWQAIYALLADSWPVTVGVIVIAAAFLFLEYYYQGKENQKNEAMITTLEAIAEKLGVDVDEHRSEKPKTK